MRTASKYGYAGRKRKRRYSRRDERRYIIAGIISIILLVCISTVLISDITTAENVPKEEKDPHEGQVYLYDGFDWIWMTPLEGVEVNDLTEDDFSVSNGKIIYTGDKYDVLRGIDVSTAALITLIYALADAGTPRAAYLTMRILKKTFLKRRPPA